MVLLDLREQADKRIDAESACKQDAGHECHKWLTLISILYNGSKSGVYLYMRMMCLSNAQDRTFGSSRPLSGGRRDVSTSKVLQVSLSYRVWPSRCCHEIDVQLNRVMSS